MYKNVNYIYIYDRKIHRNKYANIKMKCLILDQ